MKIVCVDTNDVFGFVRPELDAHTLGITTVAELIKTCGYKVYIGDDKINHAVTQISTLNGQSYLLKWIKLNKITRLGFSYRLDPENAMLFFGKLYHFLHRKKLLHTNGGQIKQVYFAGLPEGCRMISKQYGGAITVFIGDETPAETLKNLGIEVASIPLEVINRSSYDSDRMSFAKDLINSGSFTGRNTRKPLTYPSYGGRKDTLAERVLYNKQQADHLPLIRAHVGPYRDNYQEAKKEFLEWIKYLSVSGYLDILSIGSSQLSQSNFGEEWGSKPNGGGVPINSVQDLIDIYGCSRPMLVRTYAGTKNIRQLSSIFEDSINIAWHALSIWWFNVLDGRGPNSVRANIEEHLSTLDYIALSGKPYEPNIPHHFAFRGSDDYSYVLSAYLAAKMAKKKGIKHLVIQIMLNTPKHTWGVQDLAKARALVKLIRELEDASFETYLQPRAGLGYFSPDLDKAKMQLAAVTAMMDDIEPSIINSPDIIHVVSYCEANQLANPIHINESIQITLEALYKYRQLKKRHEFDNKSVDFEVATRTDEIFNVVKSIIELLESRIDYLYTAKGFYDIFRRGVFPVPYLWESRDEFNQAVKWNTGIIGGGMFVIDENGSKIDPIDRIKNILDSNQWDPGHEYN